LKSIPIVLIAALIASAIWALAAFLAGGSAVWAFSPLVVVLLIIVGTPLCEIVWYRELKKDRDE